MSRQEIIDKLEKYIKLEKEAMNEPIIIADSDSLCYGRIQAYNVCIELLKDLEDDGR